MTRILVTGNTNVGTTVRYVEEHDPHAALRHAVVFAGHKVGAPSSSQGFLDREQLARLAEQRSGSKR